MLKAVHIIMGVAILVVGFRGIACVISMGGLHIPGLGKTRLWMASTRRKNKIMLLNSIFLIKTFFFYIISLQSHTRHA